MSYESILVIGDDPALLEAVRTNLPSERYRVVGFASADQGIEEAYRGLPDLILLDAALPDGDGVKLCRALKNDVRTMNVPIILLSVKSEDADMAAVRAAGADGYIVRPLHPRALSAGIKTTLRKGSGLPEASVLEAGEIVIDPGRFRVWAGNNPIDLTVTEFRILHLLASHPGRVFKRDQIIRAIRGDEYAATDRSVDVQIVGIRRRLGGYGSYIQTVRGVGYRFKDYPFRRLPGNDD